jgi:hypothetical protein
VFQFFTAAILFLAANTAYSGFPMLAAILARDGFLPRFFHQRGNRLVFSYGIAALTGLAILLLVVFNASTTRLIPLYALGVFLCFTLAQAGLVKHWLRTKDPGWRRSLPINAFGCAVTGIVCVIIVVTKFADGGWIVVVAIPLITFLLYRIGRFYVRLERELHVPATRVFDFSPKGASRSPVLVPVEDINLPTVVALGTACERSSSVTAVHVHYDPEEQSPLLDRWDTQFPQLPLVVIESPYRTVAEPLSWYVNDRLKEWPNATLLMPTIQVRHWWQRPLVNQSLGRLRKLLGRRRTVEIVEEPYGVG